MALSSWNIAFGDYELSVDRRALTLTLTETKTETVWGSGVSLGWMEVQHRETGEVTRHDFGTMRQVSVSEKAGPQGKRVLWGLDLDGVPVDLYLICSQREIQMVVEASRDSRTHRVQGFGLVPSLCRVSDDGSSYLVVPEGDGARYRAGDVADNTLLPVWDAIGGVTMPFAGAVRRGAATSALALLTDSAYGNLRLTRHESDSAVSPEYERDPERRRLDLRIVTLPNGDGISVARTYREKLINDSNHVTLRRKLREQPLLAGLLEQETVVPVRLSDAHNGPVRSRTPEDESAWEYQERYLHAVEKSRPAHPDLLHGDGGGGDWANVALAWNWLLPRPAPPAIPVPLYAVVYHDALMRLQTGDTNRDWLRLLLHLGFKTQGPAILGLPQLPVRDEPWRSLFYSLPRLTFSAFLTEHRFLSADYLVEEAVYSDKTRVVINQSETETYESAELTLPPMGFYVRHAQMEAHDALRVGAETFDTRRWRIRRAGDGKRLEESNDVLRQEWQMPMFQPDIVDDGETNPSENPFQE